MLSEYISYLIKIRKSFIDSGISLEEPVIKRYEDTFYLGELLTELLWFYSIIEIGSGKGRLEGFMFPLNPFSFGGTSLVENTVSSTLKGGIRGLPLGGSVLGSVGFLPSISSGSSEEGEVDWDSDEYIGGTDEDSQSLDELEFENSDEEEDLWDLDEDSKSLDELEFENDSEEEVPWFDEDEEKPKSLDEIEFENDSEGEDIWDSDENEPKSLDELEFENDSEGEDSIELFEGTDEDSQSLDELEFENDSEEEVPWFDEDEEEPNSLDELDFENSNEEEVPWFEEDEEESKSLDELEFESSDDEVDSWSSEDGGTWNFSNVGSSQGSNSPTNTSSTGGRSKRAKHSFSQKMNREMEANERLFSIGEMVIRKLGKKGKTLSSKLLESPTNKGNFEE